VTDSDASRLFRATVLEAYRPLLERAGFRELPRRPGAHLNEFSLRIGNSTTVIEVEGIGYGAEAWTKVFRAGEADDEPYGLPIGELLALRAPKRQGAAGRPVGQPAQIAHDASAMQRLAPDVLAGDFTALDELVRSGKRRDAERLAARPSPLQKAADAASAEAGHAFKRGDHRSVVELLAPHLDHLSPSQRRRLERSRALLDGS
jgi:hypothetical protein